MESTLTSDDRFFGAVTSCKHDHPENAGLEAMASARGERLPPRRLVENGGESVFRYLMWLCVE